MKNYTLVISVVIALTALVIFLITITKNKKESLMILPVGKGKPVYIYFDTPAKKAERERTLILQDGAYTSVPDYVGPATEINKLYAKKWGYKYKLLMHPVDKLPPYWLKVVDVYNEMKTGNYDKILYMDLDACFMDFDMSIEEILSEIGNQYDVYGGQDSNPLVKVNSGVFLFRNTPMGLKILSEWVNFCQDTTDGKIQNSCNYWKYNGENFNTGMAGSSWTCYENDGKVCEWGGSKFEQQTLGDLFKLYPQNCIVLPEEYFSNQLPNQYSFILHMMGAKNDIRNDVFRRILLEKRMIN